jgi:hypothetical protein
VRLSCAVPALAMAVWVAALACADQPIDGERAPQSHWKRDGSGWRRVTRGPEGVRRHEWTSERPPGARPSEAPVATSGLYRTWIARGTGSWPEVVGIGDLNGDGRNDVVLLTSFYFSPEADWTAHVFLQQPGGFPQAGVKYPLGAIGGNGCQSVDVGDVTGDGRADVVVATSNGIVVLAQNAAGALNPPTLYATTEADQLKIGDFNHDGRKDVASIGWGGPDVAVRLQNVGGTLDAPASYPAPHGGYDELEAGDLDNDGRDDLAVMSGQLFAYDNLAVLLQSAAGGFQPASFYDIGTNLLTQGAEVADVNGDGRRDAILTYGSTTSGALAVFRQSASGSLVLEGSAGSYYGPSSIEAADLDGNGRTDLAVLHEDSALGVFLQNAAGELTLETLEPIPYVAHYQPQSLALGDLNGDGKPDAAIADLNVGLVVLYQKMSRDLSLTIEGVSWLPAGSDAAHTLRVTNQGLTTAAGVRTTSTLSGLAAANVPPGCAVVGNTVTCDLPAIPPGETRSVNLTVAGLSVTTQASHQATVASDQPDGLPEDNTRTMPVEVAAGGCHARLYLGGFEGVTLGNIVWEQSSTSFGTPVCSTFTCFPPPTAGPRSPSQYWAWFGRNGGVEHGQVAQRVLIPFGTARLRFYLWIGTRSGNGTDTLRVLVDGAPAFVATEATPGFGSYELVDVDVSAWADGGFHEVRFDAQTFGPGVTNFSVDDVSVEWCPLPRMSIGDVLALEGGPLPAGNATFALTLDKTWPEPITVGYATEAPATGPSATPGVDFVPVSGTLTFPPGATSRLLAVPLLADTTDEVDEAFLVRLSAPSGATFADSESVGTIDDDDGPTLTIGDVTVTEPPQGQGAEAVLPITLSGPSVQPVTMYWFTGNGTAQYHFDYIPKTELLAFAPGQTEATARVSLMGDTIAEPIEYFRVDLHHVRDAFAVDSNAVAHILDDDGPAPLLRGDLGHGHTRWGTLAARGGNPARDLYVLSRPAQTSFEVTVDSASGDVGTGAGPRVRRLYPPLTATAQESVPIGTGPARSLRVENATFWPEADYIEVTSAGCATDCGADDTYRITSRETTSRIPRFNNTGGQVAVLVLQNAGTAAVSGNAWFYDAEGALLTGHPFSLPGRGSLTILTPSVAWVANEEGSITVTHDGPYGAVTGKAVSLDVAGGFSFDSVLEPKAR